MQNVHTLPSASPHSAAAAAAANAGLDPRVSVGKAEVVDAPLSDRTAAASILPLHIIRAYLASGIDEKDKNGLCEVNMLGNPKSELTQLLPQPVREQIALHMIPHAFKANFVCENSTPETFQASLAVIGIDLDIDLDAEIDVMGQMAHDCVDLPEGTQLPEGLDSVARFYEVYPDVQTFYKKHGMLASIALETQRDLYKFINAGYLQAMARIQEDTSTKALEVALLDSNELPSDIGTLTQLEELTIDPQVMPPTSLVSHVLTLPKSAPPMRVHLPTTLWALKQLTSLNLSRSSKGVLPSEITTLPKLKTLDVSENELTEIPSWIGLCQALKTFIASQNQLATLPVALKKCSALKTLKLCDNPIATMALPTFWGRLKQAVYLDYMPNSPTIGSQRYSALRSYLIETYTRPECDVVIEEPLI